MLIETVGRSRSLANIYTTHATMFWVTPSLFLCFGAGRVNPVPPAGQVMCGAHSELEAGDSMPGDRSELASMECWMEIYSTPIVALSGT